MIQGESPVRDLLVEANSAYSFEGKGTSHRVDSCRPLRFVGKLVCFVRGDAKSLEWQGGVGSGE